MLFEKQDTKLRFIRILRKLRPVIFVILVIVALNLIPACTATKGSILILENPDGTGFTMDFNEWSSVNKCELPLNKGDEVQIEVARTSGKISLFMSGKNGSEPYTGSNLKSGVFTVTVAETDQYIFHITGISATGKIIVSRMG